MTNARTSGMTALGIVNIVFGALGTLGGIAIMGVAGLMTASAGTLAAENPGMGGIEEVATSGGLIFAIMGAGLALMWFLAFVGGIGILRLSTWARPVNIIAGTMLLVLGLYNLVLEGAIISGMISAGYGAVIAACFFSGTWKHAFSKQGAAERVDTEANPQPVMGGSPLAGAMPPAMASSGLPGMPKVASESASESPTSGLPGIPAAATESTKPLISAGLPGMPPAPHEGKRDAA